MNRIQVLSMIENTLNTIHVSGEENMDHLLACIRALRTLRNELEKEVAAENGEPA